MEDAFGYGWSSAYYTLPTDASGWIFAVLGWLASAYGIYYFVDECFIDKAYGDTPFLTNKFQYILEDRIEFGFHFSIELIVVLVETIVTVWNFDWYMNQSTLIFESFYELANVLIYIF
jgi:hypothetical protein